MTAGGAGAALLLVDLQHDYLRRPGLVPFADVLVARAATMLRGWRDLSLPVVHAHTITRADGTDRMPHWAARDVHACVEGTRGAAPPEALAPASGELVVRKRFYDAFADERLDAWLREGAVGRIVLVGVYAHACIRETALAAYARGYDVCIVEDAIGTTDPVHAALTHEYLAERGVSYRSAMGVLAHMAGDDPPRATWTHRNPCRTSDVLSVVPLGGAAEVRAAAAAVAAAQPAWAAVEVVARAAALDRWAAVLEAERASLAGVLVREIAKPRRAAEEELDRAIAHVRGAADLVRATVPEPVAPGVVARPCSVGVVGLITPWNNPIAIPVGKIAPAIGFGNGVVWKPAPQAFETARALAASLRAADVPVDLVGLVAGAEGAARALCREPAVAAVSLTGSVDAGRVAGALCAQAMKPLQAELGGNNAAVVLADVDLADVVGPLVESAFLFAGQRCTAVRRFVVERAVAGRFEALAAAAVATLRLGPPADPATVLGPMVSVEQRDRVLAAIDEARATGARVVVGGVVPDDGADGAWLLPTLLADAAPDARIVQEETFGPVAVLQVADDLDHAIALANGVPHGLLQCVYTRDARARARVHARAQAGIVRSAVGPVAVHPNAPFGGWKASGLGPPEHGRWDAAFYTRMQAVYGGDPC